MTISVIADYNKVNVKLTTFSDGGEYLKIDLPPKVDSLFITIADEPASRYLWLLSLIGEILYDVEYNSITLNIPYLPFARADRKFDDGMAIPLRVFLRQLSKLSYKINNLILYDVHNEEAVNSWRWQDSPGIELVTQVHCFNDAIKTGQHTQLRTDYKNHDVVLVAPDKGAIEKIKQFNMAKTVTLDKVRDPKTGYIHHIEVVDGQHLIRDRKMIIVDDICDGGATFIMAAKLLRELGASEVHLYVTHGIFSKGMEIFKPHIDSIVCWQTVMNYVSFNDIYEYNERSK